MTFELRWVSLGVIVAGVYLVALAMPGLVARRAALPWSRDAPWFR